MADLTQAEIVLASSKLTEDMTFFESVFFKLASIYPPDDPVVAIMCGHGMKIRLDRNAPAACSSSAIINIFSDDLQYFPNGQKQLIAPNGMTIRLLPKTFQLKRPQTRHSFQVCKLVRESGATHWTTGRAGMLYRDLIPDRLGGAIIASHICIPGGGPVKDMVHFHTVSFQLIYCYRGWVRVVYEDQGPPFVLEAGDCVTQPPEIRHRVLESSENAEVVEVGVPVEHMTTIDHGMELPTQDYRPNREFNGQTFCHHQLAKAKWVKQLDGFEFRETGINEATRGLASVRFVRPLDSTKILLPLTASNSSDIYFVFIVDGEMELYAEGYGMYSLGAGDALVVPPHFEYELRKFSDCLEFLEVKLPGK